MLTVQTNIALQIIATLTQEEMAAFGEKFDKLRKPVAICKPKNKHQLILEKANQILAELEIEHCFKSIPAQGKLA